MLIRLWFVVLLFLISAGVRSAALDQQSLPDNLQPWVDWVLHDYPEIDCPVRFDSSNRDCIWPGELVVSASDRGAVFDLSVTLYREGQIILPGDLRHWPASVTVKSQPVAVIEVDGMPAIQLAAGRHTIKGAFSWQRAPDSLAINPHTGILRYFWNGEAVSPPQWHNNALWIRAHLASTGTATAEDILQIQVSRRINDGHPLTVITRLQLEVAGSQREVNLGNAVPEGFVAQQLVSDQLPARLNPDGGLQVQVRPGIWQIDVTSHRVGRVDSIAFEEQDLPWPAEETWVYQSSAIDRITELAGPPQVDPRSTRLPPLWQELPAYQLTPGDVLEINTVRRGNPTPEPDQLSLRRELWLDFDGHGYSVHDQLGGELRGSWRLNVQTPLQLGQVQVNGRAQFITSAADGTGVGVEVRQGQLNVTADARIEAGSRTLPATGWSLDFQQASTQLYTPPGWRVLNVGGVDNVPGAWLWQWTVYDLFLLLIIVLAVAKLWRWYWGGVATIALVLIWHETAIVQIVVLLLLASVALLRVVPKSGKLFTVLRAVRLLILLLFAVVLLPFLVEMARDGLFPQLEIRNGGYSQPISPANGNAALRTSRDKPQRRQTSNEADISAEAKSGIVDRLERELATSTSAYAPKTRYIVDPAAIVQTGQGTPSWRWHTTELSWNGPVIQDQSIQLYLLGPRVVLLLRLTGIVFLLLLAWRLLDTGRGSANPPKPGKRTARLWFVALFTAYTGAATAADFPSPELLEQLTDRLLEQTREAPRASIQSIDLNISPEQMTASLHVHALQDTVIPLLMNPNALVPLSISIDNASATHQVFRDQQHMLWLLVPAGLHSVKLTMALIPVDQLQLPLPLMPHRVSVKAEGWSVQGLDVNGVPQGHLSLVRVKTDTDTADTLTARKLPAFYSVQRSLTLGLRWQITTLVRRLAGSGAAASITLPLLPGESVTSDNFDVKDGKIRVTMDVDTSEVAWQSVIEPTDTLILSAADSKNWVEQWQLDIGSMWHAEFDGIAPAFHQDKRHSWLPTWRPWPSESMTLHVTRPVGVPGRTRTIDHSDLTVTPGKRSTESRLAFTLRSSQGGKHEITLPAGAQLQSITSNNRSLPLRISNRVVSVAITPGEQRIELVWRNDAGISNIWHTPNVDLGVAHVNSSLTVSAPSNRWILWLDGPLLGPAVLFWGVVLVMLLLASALAAASRGSMPIGWVSWLLLGVGLAQVSVLALLPVAVWLFLLRLRSELDRQIGKGLFNVLQISIVVLTVISIGILLTAVQNGLLGLPEMQVMGNRSYAHTMHWFQDRSESQFPQATIVSIPLLFYRALMLVWALWLALSLLRWLRWGWNAFSQGGLWSNLDWKGSARKKQPASHAVSGIQIDHQN